MAIIDKILITIDDVRQYREMSANIDKDILDTYIRQAQVLDLKPILNPYLYLDFIKKVDNKGDPLFAAYQNLLCGTEYEDDNGDIQFDGIKPLLALFTHARIAQKTSAKITRTGVIKKVTTESEQASSDEIQKKATDSKSIGIAYIQQLRKFLTDNSDIYTLWNQDEGIQDNNKTSVMFGKAQNVGNKYGAQYPNEDSPNLF